MTEVDKRSTIAIAKTLMSLLNTGDWMELFQITDCEEFLNINQKFLDSVGCQNDDLKLICIKAVNFILDSDKKNLSILMEFNTVSKFLRKNHNKEFEKITKKLEGNDAKIVLSPEVENNNQSIFQALADAESLIASQGAPSAYDRMHTALHSFLREVCDNHSISYKKNDSITGLLPKINEYIKQNTSGENNEQTYQMIRSANAILDKLNYLRNHHSMSHPTNALLSEQDALFAINISRSIMTYLDSII